MELFKKPKGTRKTPVPGLPGESEYATNFDQWPKKRTLTVDGKITFIPQGCPSPQEIKERAEIIRQMREEIRSEYYDRRYGGCLGDHYRNLYLPTIYKASF